MRQHSTAAHWRKLHLTISLLLVLFSIPYAESLECSENEYLHKSSEHPEGFCCDKCHPGFKLKQKCSAPGRRSVCEKCDPGTYSEKANYYENCFRCTSCKKTNMETVSNCMFTSNSKCKCKDGFYIKQLGSSTSECLPCKKCGPGQLKIGNCTGEDHNHCKCEDKHYRVKPNLCKPCVSCQDGCEHLCNNISRVTVHDRTVVSDGVSKIAVPVCACFMVLAVGVFMLYEGIRLQKKRTRALSAPSSSSSDPVLKTEVKSMVVTVSPDTTEESVLITNELCRTGKCRELPDCVPREIKVNEFIYFALDEIPVGRFKELVRRLGITEQDIDRAERDNRAFKDAQYQMLKVWSDRGSGRGNNILPGHFIQMFIEILKDMCLANCADSIDNKFLQQEVLH